MNKLSPFLRRRLFILLLALMVASDSTAQVVESRIVFSSNRDGDWDIYSMDANGDNLAQLTNHPASDEYPAGSPDGRRIAFRSERDGTPDLYVMDSDGSNVIRLTHDNFREGRPSWTPDGTKIAFSNFIFAVGNSEIYLMDPDGTGVINLTKHKWHEVRPSWSSDGRKIAFVSMRDGDFKTPRDIFVMNADGTERRNLTGETALMDNFSPNWSPDGQKIAFDSRRHIAKVTHDDIFVITTDGKELEQLTEDGVSRSAVYSPDGTKIAYVSRRGGGANIFLMDSNGRNAVKLTKTPPGVDNVSPSWLFATGAFAVSPNGKLSTSWGELKRIGNPR